MCLVSEFLLPQGKLWLAVFSLDSLRYLIGAGLVSVVLYGLLGSWSAGRRIQQRRATAADIRREISYSLLTTAVYATVALFTIEAVQRGWMQNYELVAEQGWWYTVLSLPLLLVLHDAYFYWAHRLMHHRRLFRWVHRVHHLSRTPTPWAAYSFAPAEALVMALFMPAILALMPLQGVVVFIFLGIMILRNAMGHSGVEFHPRQWVDSPLDLMTTTTHHDMHHQQFNGNYGLYFTWWDRWMGTEFPEYKVAFHQAIAETLPVDAALENA
jgi:sterol desaturase/sphingolipid hydroxylase (fatty acid hydroxylase superfamily)